MAKIGINYYFGEREFGDGFLTRDDVSPYGASARGFAQRLMRLFDVEVHGVDCVDATADDVKAVLYMDGSWRSLREDRFLENNASQPGYISEKITDCFAARCVPIYLGSPGYQKYIPRVTYIDYADFKSLAELEKFLASMSEADHARYLDAIDRFVRSPEFNHFSADRFAGIVGEGLGLAGRGDSLLQ